MLHTLERIPRPWVIACVPNRFLGLERIRTSELPVVCFGWVVIAATHTAASGGARGRGTHAQGTYGAPSSPHRVRPASPASRFCASDDTPLGKKGSRAAVNVCRAG